jgi:hypothetical protein
VVTWNTAELTSATLRRLMDSDQGCDLRLLVRDNGSSDGTVDLLRTRVPEADIDAGTENLGFAAGVNTVLARSDAPWFFMLNSDAWPEPGAIAALVRAAHNRPAAAAVAPRIEDEDGRLEHSTHPFPSLRLAATIAFAWNRLSPERADRLMLEGSWKHDRARPVDWAIGAAVLLRREAVDDVGAFDDRFFMYVEDLEWCWRARKHGWEIFFEPSALVRHVGNASGEQMFGGTRTREHVRNAYRFYRREHGVAGTVAWWGLNVAATSIRLAEALASRDRGRARRWREHVAAHLAAMRPVKVARGGRIQ